MARPFDAAMKELILHHSEDWLEAFGLPPGLRLLPEDTNITNVTIQADKVFRIAEEPPWLLHVELQASRNPGFSDRMLVYNVLLWRERGLPVESVAVLLRPEAEGAVRLDGILRREPPPGGLSRHEFQFRVVRIWETPARRFLEGGLGTLPLAPLADLTGTDAETVCRAVERRILEEAPLEERNELWASLYLLMGMRYKPADVARLLKGIGAMQESSTYQEILQTGREEGMEKGQEIGAVGEGRRMVLRAGARLLGPPDDTAKLRVGAISNLETLERLHDRAFDVDSWDALFATLERDA